MEDVESIISLLRACVAMSPQRCHATLKEGLRQMDERNAQNAIAAIKAASPPKG